MKANVPAVLVVVVVYVKVVKVCAKSLVLQVANTNAKEVAKVGVEVVAAIIAQVVVLGRNILL